MVFFLQQKQVIIYAVAYRLKRKFMKKLLITGATGMVGNRLIELLREKNYDLHVLSTRKNAKMEGVQFFYWNPNRFEMDESALDGVEGIIHLAGATVSKRWTTSYKQEIFDSRTRTGETLFKALAKIGNHSVKKLVSASAVGYYSSHPNKLYSENDEPGSDFLSQVCQHWEAAADKFSQLGIAVAKLRIGIVLGRTGGVLQQLETPTKFGLGAPLGNGRQWMSWIHVDDLCRMFIYAIETENFVGAFNAGAPNAVTNKEFCRTLALVMKKPFFAPPIPAFALKLALGEMATIALMSQKVSAEKALRIGFQFKFNDLREALEDFYHS